MSTDEFVITRVINAPRKLVFDAFTKAEHLVNWWGPAGCKIAIKQLDLNPGGVFHYSTTMNDTTFWGKFTYQEIDPIDKLVFLNAFSDENAGLGRHPFAPTWPAEMLTIITFTDNGPGKTSIELRASAHNATDAEKAVFAEGMPGMNAGFGGTFDALEKYMSDIQA